MTRRGLFGRIAGLAASVPLWPKMLGAGEATPLKAFAAPFRSYGMANGSRIFYATKACGFPVRDIFCDVPNQWHDPGEVHIYENIDPVPDGTASAPLGVFSASTSDV